MKQSRKKGSKLYEAVRKILIAVIVIAAVFSESSDAAAVILGLAVFALLCVSIYNYYAPNLGAKNGAGPRTTRSPEVMRWRSPSTAPIAVGRKSISSSWTAFWLTVSLTERNTSS